MLISTRAAFTFLLLFSTSMWGCSAHKDAADTATAADAATASTAGAAQASDAPSSGSDSATGHVHLTGAVTFDHDFSVDGCTVGPAGDGLLNGYHMNSKDNGPPIALLSVVVKDYAQDGSYEPAGKSAEAQVASTMNTGVAGPLTLMITQGEGQSPLTIGLKPESKMTIKIGDSGAKGDAQFTDMETRVTIADINASGKMPTHGKKVSGSVTWSCGKVDHINAKMNNAVNGMFKKLIPPK